MRLEMQQSMPAAPDDVWNVLADWERYPEWMPDVSWVRRKGSGEGADLRLAVRTKVLGIPLVTDEMAVTAWEPPRRMAIEHRGLVRGAGEWRLEPEDGGTRFTWEEILTMPPPLIGSFMLLVYSPVLRWTFGRSMRNLARQVAAPPS